MHVSAWAWAALLVVAPVMLALDLFLLPWGHDEVPAGPALRWSVVWTVVGLAFAGVVWLQSSEAYAVKYSTSFLVEKGLTIDQVLVFALVTATFRSPQRASQRAIFLALWIGLLLKIPFIALGVALGRHGPGDLRWVLGVAFALGGVILVRNRAEEPTVGENRYLRFLSGRVAFVDRWEGGRFVLRENNRRVYTLAFAMLVVLISADVYFAATIPLAFAISKPGYLVLASSTFAVIGVRSLYWWVASLRIDPSRLRVMLAIVLWLVGLDLVLQPHAHEPSWVLPALLAVTISVPLVSASRRRRVEAR